MSNNYTSKAGAVPTATAVDIDSLATYADGSIVSRTMIENDVGTITFFAFDTGQGLSEHTTPFDAFVQITDGEAELTIGGKTLNVSAGQLIIMPANVPHAVKANQKFKMLLTMLRA